MDHKSFFNIKLNVCIVLNAANAAHVCSICSYNIVLTPNNQIYKIYDQT